MTTRTQVIRSSSSMITGTVLLVVLALAPAGVLQLTGSLVASLVCLAIALLSAVVVFTLMSAQKLTYGPAGVYVVADDDHHTLAWKSIEQFDLGRWVVDGGVGRDFQARGLVIRLGTGPEVRVDWINTKRTIRRLNEALARFADRDEVPEISPKPPSEATRLTTMGSLAVFNIGTLRLMVHWPWLLWVGIVVNIMVGCVYMGVQMSKGR